MKKRILKISLILLCLLIIGELVLRYGFGFCNAVLLEKSSKYEYIAKPNQELKRFGSKIRYNSLSMRSNPINPKSKKILGFGDSVLNGGSLTDQDSLASSIISDSLSSLEETRVQFLNISAGSWGPDNCYAYLIEHEEALSADVFCLVVSSHDAYDNMNFLPIIGVNKNFPNKQYNFAISELIDRYLIPKIIKPKQNTLGINKKTNTSKFNKGFQQFNDYCKTNNIQLLVYLHPDQKELQNQTYNQQGREIIAFCKKNNLTLIKELSPEMDESYYRDFIHPNEKGQKLIAHNLISNILDLN
jgi:hypothetical protein